MNLYIGIIQNLKIFKQEFNNIPNDCFKIVYLHWGNEFVNCPSETQIKLAHWLVDLGFDLIVGMHSHVLQGFEEYKGKYIFYSIGNCLFDMAGTDKIRSNDKC